MSPSRAWIRTKGSLVEYGSYGELKPIRLETYAESDGDDAIERHIAGQMAGKIGQGQSVACAEYLSKSGR